MTESAELQTPADNLLAAQRKYDAATLAHHRRYCLTCAEGKPCVGPSVQECRDVEVILNAYDAG